MKLLVTKNMYKTTNLEMNLSSDLNEVSAYGYNWFQYLITDDVGNIIISEYTSQTSKKHIGEIVSKLNLHSKKIAIYLDFCNSYSDTFNRSISAIHDLGYYGQNLNSPKNAFNHEIDLIKDHIKLLIKEIRKPRSHKRKNEDRKNEIKNCLFKIKDLRDFKNNYLNKKVKKVKFGNNGFVNRDLKHLKEKLFQDIYGTYLKVKDTRQVNYYLNNFNVKRAYLYHNSTSGVSLRLQKIIDLFNLKSNFDFSKIVFYSHIQDINDSIPNDINSVEYNEILKIVKRLRITSENLNSLQLDKLHTAIINKNLRAEKNLKGPKIWPEYQVDKKLIEIENKVNETKKLMKLIKNQGDLKAESRKMNHCIGQERMGYHKKIFNQGYQALNYKGYTFFLNPDLTINQTHGKYNSSTPNEISSELMQLIAA